MDFNGKYRPDSFAGVYGNKSVVNSIETMLGRKDKPQSYLLIGPSGVGKTTLARIMSIKLGASSLGKVELNVADLRGIDDMRELIKRATLPIIGSKKSVFILDECHQLTVPGQNILLKMLENPPNFVSFILCTTDPQKLIKTLTSRCKTFQLGTVNKAELLKLAEKINRKENLEFTDDFLKKIVVHSNGSPRILLNILERSRGITSVDMLVELLQGYGSDNDESADNSLFTIAIRLLPYIVKRGKSIDRLLPFLQENIIKQGIDIISFKNLLISLVANELYRQMVCKDVKSCSILSQSILFLESTLIVKDTVLVAAIVRCYININK